MFERYNERARRVIFFSRYEASELASSEIQPEHLLLGLLREDRAIFAANSTAALDPVAVRERIAREVSRPEKISLSVDAPVSEAARRVLHIAADEANLLLHSRIGTGHLMLALLRERSSLAAVLLREAGFDENATRERLKTGPPSDARPAEYRPVLRPALTPDSLHVLAFAAENAKSLQQTEITPEDILHGILQLERGVAVRLLAKHQVTKAMLRQARDLPAEQP